MPDERRVANARRGASIAVALAMAMMLTSVAVVATRTALPVWLLWSEGVALTTIVLLVRADLRNGQGHVVK